MQLSSRGESVKARVYRRFRYSPLYMWYARVFRPAFARGVAADRAFFRALFAAYGVRTVYDIGANVGDKADVFRRLADRVVCVEADPDMADLLRHRYRRRPAVAVEPTALGERVGHANLRRKAYSGFNTLSEKWATVMDGQNLPTLGVVCVPVTTLDQLILRHGRPDYLKIDVEGYELPVVRGLTTAVPVLSFECNLPAFRAESDQVIDHLVGLNPATRFNARGGDAPAWALPEPTDAAGLRRFLDALAAGTCDIFAISPRRS